MALAGPLVVSAPVAADESKFALARQRMIGDIERTQREVAHEAGSRTLDRKVLAVMGDVPRHLFVPRGQQDSAYENRPLPIGHGQTISQPYIVALMTDLLRVKPGDRVFELGTGSGYQAAILAKLAKEVYTVEIVAPLGKEAAERLASLGFANVRIKVADGYHGWPEHAPFDGIMVTAAASHVPPALVRQLKPGGRMVIPVGTSFLTQHLLLVEKATDGTLTTRQVLPVRFVPLTGGH
jgi:protein-L-isoaspartate(D-aspartate) O-methyltransferase